jgi:hypothetical protein
MPDQIYCRTCRFWSRLRAGALIGRCHCPESGHSFTRGLDCCSHWTIENRTKADCEDDAVLESSLPARRGRPRKPRRPGPKA